MSEESKKSFIAILLLENHREDIQRFEVLLAEILGQEFRLKALTTLQEGLDFLKQNKVDVILASLVLADQKGESIFETLHKAVPQIPLFIVGDAVNDALALKLVGRGAHDYLIRSTFSGTMLSRVLRYAIERKKLERMKDEFIGTVSHELRTPLTIIRESVSQIMDQLYGPVNKDQTFVMGMTLDGIDRLIRIVNDLLDISKLEAGKVRLHCEYLDMVSLVQSVCRAFSAKTRNQGVKIDTQFSAAQTACYADRDKITQVLTNLIGNALKFTEKGSIHVRVGEQPEEVLVCVEDTGIGLTEQELGGLFQKFQQFGRTAGPGEKGTGLGLAISKGIIDLHHGRLWAESQLGKGSRFYLSLPKHTAREFFKQTVEDNLRQAISREEPLSLVLMTLKDFDRVEASVNPQAWADFLQKLGRRLQQDLARSLEFVHNGRQVLLAIMPKKVKQNALMLSGRIHQILSQALQEQFGGLHSEVLVKVIAYPEDGETLEAFIDKLGVF